MRPSFLPVHRSGTAIDHHRTKCNAAARADNPITELKIIRQIIRQCFKAAYLLQLFPACGHYRAEREVQRLQSFALQNLAPKIRIDGDGFPTHRESHWLSQPVKA